MESSVIIEILKDIGLPIVTAIGGWFASVWRNKQKKEGDILDNVKQILESQKQYIADQDKENKKTRDMNARLEKELRQKSFSIRRANSCKYTAEGDGCPVLAHEEEMEEKCKNCEMNSHDKGTD